MGFDRGRYPCPLGSFAGSSGVYPGCRRHFHEVYTFPRPGCLSATYCREQPYCWGCLRQLPAITGSPTYTHGWAAQRSHCPFLSASIVLCLNLYHPYLMQWCFYGSNHGCCFEKSVLPRASSRCVWGRCRVLVGHDFGGFPQRTFILSQRSINTWH